jgi:hypothetical protein
MEYNNSTIGGSACNYSTLQTYSQPHINSLRQQALNSRNTNVVTVVPSFGVPGYTALEKRYSGQGMKTCSGYFVMEQAYGQ